MLSSFMKIRNLKKNLKAIKNKEMIWLTAF